MNGQSCGATSHPRMSGVPTDGRVAENEDLSGRPQPRFSSAVTVQADAILAPLSGKQQGSPRHGGGPVQLGAGRGWLGISAVRRSCGIGAWPKPSISYPFLRGLPFINPLFHHHLQKSLIIHPPSCPFLTGLRSSTFVPYLLFSKHSFIFS